MRVEELKQKLDELDETQLQLVAKFVLALEIDTDQPRSLAPHTTPQEKAEAFLTWVSGLPKVGHSLPDEAFDRATIYD